MSSCLVQTENQPSLWRWLSRLITGGVYFAAFCLFLEIPAIASAQISLVQRGGVELDRNGLIDRALLGEALISLDAHTSGIRNRHRIAIVDVSKDSRFPRFYVLNLLDGSVRALVTTHGKGSDPFSVGRAVQVSNAVGSDASSTGAYISAEQYYSDTHRSDAVRLDGLDPTNSNARCRCVVIHAANRADGQNYASAAWIEANGHAGRSNGCLAFSNEDMAYVLSRMELGTFLYLGPVSLSRSLAVSKGECPCPGS